MVEDTVRRHVWVTGIVQGVYYRASTVEEARAHRLNGWVRNLRDGRVEAVFEGPTPAVDAVVSWCRTGPRAAVVESVEVAEETPEGLLGFSIRS